MEKQAEGNIEKRLRAEIGELGGMAVKMVSPGVNGMPDRLVLLPGGMMCFVELKAPGKKPKPVQVVVHGMLRKLGFKVFVIDSKEAIKIFIDQIKTLNL